MSLNHTLICGAFYGMKAMKDILLTLVCLCATPQEGCNHEESSACQRATQVS